MATKTVMTRSLPTRTGAPGSSRAGQADWWLAQRRDERWLPFDRALLAVVILAVWQLAVSSGLVNPRFVPSPASIAIATGELAMSGDVRRAVLDACWMVLVSSGIAAAVGIPLAAATGLSDRLYRILNPAITTLFATPKLIFLPLFILAFGVQFNAKVAYGATSALFPLMVMVIAGVRAVDPRFLKVSRALGANRAQTIAHVTIPAAMPSLFVGLWHCVKHALLGVLIVELFVSRQGVGALIRKYTATFQPENVFALIVALSLFAMLVSQLIGALEKRVSGWRKLEIL